MKIRSLIARGVIAGIIVGTSTCAASVAAPSTQVIQGQYLRLVSSADWDAASRLMPGAAVAWDLSISARTPDPSSIAVSASAQGGAPLVMDAWLCTDEWDENGCSGVITRLRSAWSIPRDGIIVPLFERSSNQVTHLRLSVTLQSPGPASTQITIRAQTQQETLAVTPTGQASIGDRLATTGATPLTPVALGFGALVMVLTGIALTRVRGGERDMETT